MSQARLPRTEPSTELITAHKVNHRAAHVAGRAPGIFAGAGSHRGRPDRTASRATNRQTLHTAHVSKEGQAVSSLAFERRLSHSLVSAAVQSHHTTARVRQCAARQQLWPVSHRVTL